MSWITKGSIRTTYPGWYTIDLNTPVKLTKGQDFAVIVRVKSTVGSSTVRVDFDSSNGMGSSKAFWASASRFKSGSWQADDNTCVKAVTTGGYLIKFTNEDGTVLQSDVLEYGAKPSYRGSTPTKGATVQYTYTFAGWTPAVANVTGDTTYRAAYTRKLKTYTVTWRDEDGRVLEIHENVPYGTVPKYLGLVGECEGASYVRVRWPDVQG